MAVVMDFRGDIGVRYRSARGSLSRTTTAHDGSAGGPVVERRVDPGRRLLPKDRPLRDDPSQRVRHRNATGQFGPDQPRLPRKELSKARKRPGYGKRVSERVETGR